MAAIWRRSCDTPPPALERTGPRSERGDLRYAKLKSKQIPRTACLKDKVERVMPFWNDSLAPAIDACKRVAVAAHGNSIRALVKYLDNISDAELKPIRHYYLGDAEAAAKAAAAVGNQDKA